MEKYVPNQVLGHKQQAAVQGYILSLGAATPTDGLSPQRGLLEGNLGLPGDLPELRI